MILYYLLVFSLPLLNQRFFAAQIGGFTAEKWLGLFCLLYAGVEAASKRAAPRWLATPQARAFLLFYVIAALSYFALGSHAAETNMLVVYSLHFIFFLTTLILVDSVARLRRTLFSAAAGVGLASLYLIREWLHERILYGADYRPGYVAGDPNYFTASAILLLPFLFYVLSERGNRRERGFSLAILALTLLAIMLGASRGGFIGLVVAALYLIWRSRRRRRNFAFVALFLALAIAAAPSTPLARLLHPNSSDQEAAQDRLQLWRAGLAMFARHPLTGVGVGNFKLSLPAYLPAGTEISFLAHNTYVEMAAEMGGPGLLAFLAILVFTLASLGRSRRHALALGADFSCLAAASLQVGLVGFGVCIFFISAAFLKLFWFTVFISACLPPILFMEAAESEAGGEAAVTGEFLGEAGEDSEEPRYRGPAAEWLAPADGE